MIVLLFSLLLQPASRCWAIGSTPSSSVQPAASSSSEQAPRQKPAIRNTYAGGQDEDDLRVQKQLFVPTAILDRRTLNLKVVKNARSGSADVDDGDGGSQNQ